MDRLKNFRTWCEDQNYISRTFCLISSQACLQISLQACLQVVSAPSCFAQEFQDLLSAFNGSDYKQAISLGEEYVKQHAKHAEARYYLARSYMKQGQMALAEDQLRNAMALAPAEDVMANCIAALKEISQANLRTGGSVGSASASGVGVGAGFAVNSTSGSTGSVGSGEVSTPQQARSQNFDKGAAKSTDKSTDKSTVGVQNKNGVATYTFNKPRTAGATALPLSKSKVVPTEKVKP